MGTTLFDNGRHKCLMFTELVGDEHGAAVQSNQFLIIDNEHGALIDPGGVMTYNELYIASSHYFAPKQLDWILASHADPDIIASVGRWLTSSSCQLAISSVWARFVPHFCPTGKTEGRIVPIPDAGMHFPLGHSRLTAVPAHFLHSEGNFQFYDPVSRILFSGDLGASMVSGAEASRPVDNFDAHLPSMEGFHRRYMTSNKICRLWVNMVRTMDVDAIVPQHGRPFMGKPAVQRFLAWIEQLECGIDLLDQRNYIVPP